MGSRKYEIRYLPTFISQFNSILYYIAYELKNKIAADNFYTEVVEQIEFSINSISVDISFSSWTVKFNSFLNSSHFVNLFIFLVLSLYYIYLIISK